MKTPIERGTRQWYTASDTAQFTKQVGLCVDAVAFAVMADAQRLMRAFRDASREFNDDASQALAFAQPASTEGEAAEDLRVWHVAMRMNLEDADVAARLRGHPKVLVKIVFGDDLNASPQVSITAPRVVGPSLFLGVVCAKDFAEGEFNIENVVPILHALREHVMAQCTVEGDGEFAQDERDGGAAWIAANHPEWRVQSSLGSETTSRVSDLLKRARSAWRAAQAAAANPLLIDNNGVAQARWEEAFAAFREAGELMPSAQLFNEFGTALFAANRYDEAHEMFALGVRKSPLELHRYNLANASFAGGHIERAIAEFEGVQRAAYNESLRTQLLRARVNKGEVTDAIEAWTDMVKAHPSANNVGELGVALFNAQRFEEAHEQFELACNIEPHNEHHFNRANASFAAGNLDRAAREIDDVQYQPAYATLFGNVFVYRFRRAGTLVRDELQFRIRSLNSASLFNEVGCILFVEGAYEEAHKWFDLACEHPDAIDLFRYNRLNSSVTGNNLDRAVLEVDGVPHKQQYVMTINRARIHQYRRADPEDRQMLEAWALEHPAADVFNEIGSVHFNQQRYDVAHAWYQRACELSDANNVHRFNKANASFMVGDTRRSLREFKDVVPALYTERLQTFLEQYRRQRGDSSDDDAADANAAPTNDQAAAPTDSASAGGAAGVDDILDAALDEMNAGDGVDDAALDAALDAILPQ